MSDFRTQAYKKLDISQRPQSKSGKNTPLSNCTFKSSAVLLLAQMQSEKGDTPAKMGSYCGINNKTRDYLPKRMYVFAGVRVNCILPWQRFLLLQCLFRPSPQQCNEQHIYIHEKKKKYVGVNTLFHTSIYSYTYFPVLGYLIETTKICIYMERKFLHFFFSIIYIYLFKINKQIAWLVVFILFKRLKTPYNCI